MAPPSGQRVSSWYRGRSAIQAGLRFMRKPITFAQFEATMAEVVAHAAAR
jgi:hypothetical protein